MAFLEETINWANYADSSDKVAFFKEFIQFFGKDELNAVRGIVNRKRKNVFTEQEDAVRTWKGPRLFTGCRNSVRNPSNDVIPPEEMQLVNVVAENNLNERHWTKEIAVEEFLAFDVEAASRYVKFLDPQGRMWKPLDVLPPKGTFIMENEARVPKAAYLSIVDHAGYPIYEQKIQYLPGTYRVDFFSKTTANISSSSQLKDGKPFQEVVKKFQELTIGKYLITCGGGNDFRYLEISPTNLRRFDLQAFYRRSSSTNPEKDEPMSLRDIYFYHFSEDFQRGPHDATIDARATMKCFLEGFCKIDFTKNYDFSDVPNLKRLAAKGLYYCKTEKSFIKRCMCKPCNNVTV